MPALSFLPLSDDRRPWLLSNIDRAKQLVGDAGYLNGADFPKIRLLINRNDTQQRVARAVAKMWKQNLNLDTEIVVKELSEIDALRGSGEYDLVRRGVVLPTVDEMASLAAIFPLPHAVEQPSVQPTPIMGAARPESEKGLATAEEHAELNVDKNGIVSEEQAVFEIPAIPLYFPMSYALVKPYFKGFEINGLDAIMLNEISFDSSWQKKRP